MSAKSLLQKLKTELGITTLLTSSRDVYILFLTRLLRMLAYGSSTLILALYFSALGHSDAKIGLFMTLTLVGDVLISLALTFVADALGRRKILILGSLMMVFSGSVFAIVSNYWILLLAAVVGVISPSGNEIGPFRAVEEATLAQLSVEETRSDIFAWYVVIGTLGASGGSLLGGWMTQGLQDAGWEQVSAFRFVFWIYAALGVVKAGLGFLLSSKCEVVKESEEDRGEFLMEQLPEEDEETPASAPPPPPKPTKKSTFAQISRESRITLTKLCGLFFFDSLASGMAPNSLIAFFLSKKFSIPESTLGTIIAIAQFVSSIGNIFASAVAKRIGLIKAMVFTHLPSAIFLALLPLPSSLIITMILLFVRGTLSSMDQAPRSAFLSRVVKPEERTATMGIVNTVKTMSQSAGPFITGLLAGEGKFWIAFVTAGSLKAGYDLGMLRMFVRMNDETKNVTPAVADDDDDDDESEEHEMLPQRQDERSRT